MKCKIVGVYGNPRYKILDIGKNTYILDVGGTSLWRIIFPLLYWMFPVNVYKVNDERVINKIIYRNEEQNGAGLLGLLGGIVALGLGGLIYPFLEYLDVDTTPLIGTVIILVTSIFVCSFIFYLNALCGRKLGQHIHLEEHRKEKLWIRPNSKGYCLHVLFFYLLMVAFTAICINGSINYPNSFVFFAFALFLFITLSIGIMTIRIGDTTVRFKRNLAKKD